MQNMDNSSFDAYNLANYNPANTHEQPPQPLKAELSATPFNFNYQSSQSFEHTQPSYPPQTPLRTSEVQASHQTHATAQQLPINYTPSTPAHISYDTPKLSSQFGSPAVPSLPVLTDSPVGPYKINAAGNRTSPRKNKGESNSADTTVVAAEDGGKEKKGKGRPKGKGSKSGPNARGAGKSDDEISVLSKTAKTQATIPKPAARANWTDEEKEIALSYIVDERRWPNFKVNQNVIFTFVSKQLYSIYL